MALLEGMQVWGKKIWLRLRGLNEKCQSENLGIMTWAWGVGLNGRILACTWRWLISSTGRRSTIDALQILIVSVCISRKKKTGSEGLSKVSKIVHLMASGIFQLIATGGCQAPNLWLAQITNWMCCPPSSSPHLQESMPTQGLLHYNEHRIYYRAPASPCFV